MRHRCDKSDPDTDTGLPRKALAKFGMWAGRSLVALAVWFGTHVYNELSDMKRMLSDTNQRVARMEGKLNIVAGTDSSFVAAHTSDTEEGGQ